MVQRFPVCSQPKALTSYLLFSSMNAAAVVRYLGKLFETIILEQIVMSALTQAINPSTVFPCRLQFLIQFFFTLA